MPPFKGVGGEVVVVAVVDVAIVTIVGVVVVG
jgi:hypothetical protein